MGSARRVAADPVDDVPLQAKQLLHHAQVLLHGQHDRRVGAVGGAQAGKTVAGFQHLGKEEVLKNVPCDAAVGVFKQGGGHGVVARCRSSGVAGGMASHSSMSLAAGSVRSMERSTVSLPAER